MPNNKPKSTRGGYRPGAGRKTARKIHRDKAFTIFADQMPMTDSEIRERLDLLNKIKNILFDFDIEFFIKALSLNPTDYNTCISDMLTALLEAKELYKK